MYWQFADEPSVDKELHFAGRQVMCFRDRPHSIDEMLHQAAVRNGAGDAIACGGVTISYEELDSMVNSIAAHLAALGVGRGDRIALVLGNCTEFICALMAAARIAAIAVPVNIREQTPELTYILNHCGASVLIHDAAIADRLPAAHEIDMLTHRFSVGGSAEHARSFEDLLGNPESEAPGRQASEEDVAVILYTSGTTGRPKGAMLTHFNICHSVMHFELCMGLTQADRSMLAVPASHVTGLIANILTMIRTAGCNVILPVFEASGFLELATRERITHTVIVPAMYALCLLRADFEDFDLGSWRIGGYGGAPMPEATIAALADQLPDLILVNAYGATEVTSPATIMPMGATGLRPDSVGKPVPCGEIRIVDPDGREVPRGDAGEIWIGGPMVVPGYWNEPATTAAAFSGGFWKLGDVGSMDDDGFVRIHDRMKDMIIRGGYNIYSAEIENTLTHYPGVVESAAVARPDAVLGEKIQVFVRTTRNDISADDLRQFCAGRLADYKVPDFITFLDAPLPRNANGKILKKTLREWSKQD